MTALHTARFVFLGLLLAFAVAAILLARRKS